MFLTIFARVAALVLLLSFAVTLVTSVHSESESFGLTSLGQTQPIGNNTALPLRGRSDDDQHLDQSRDGHAPSQQVASPRQECPTDPPVDCIESNCDGSYDPPDPYRCKSKSTTTINLVEVTLSGCRCCHYPHFWCDDEKCNGGSDLRCHSEIQMGCPCFDPDEEPVLTPVSPMINPATPVLDLQENLAILITPVGPLKNLEIHLGAHREELGCGEQQVHIEKLRWRWLGSEL